MSIVGDSSRIRCVFKVDGTATDPTTVVFQQKTPAGVESSLTYGTDAEVVRVSAGSFYVDVEYTEAGKWFFRWKGTGDVVAAAELSRTVSGSSFTVP